MITPTAFVVLFGLGACVVKLANVARRAVLATADQRSAPATRSA